FFSIIFVVVIIIIAILVFCQGEAERDKERSQRTHCGVRWTRGEEEIHSSNLVSQQPSVPGAASTSRGRVRLQSAARCPDDPLSRARLHRRRHFILKDHQSHRKTHSTQVYLECNTHYILLSLPGDRKMTRRWSRL
ncbi:unnamed protein product, partial [Linum tenue]